MWTEFMHQVAIMQKIADVSVIPNGEIWTLTAENPVSGSDLYNWDRKLKTKIEPSEMDLGIDNKRELFVYRNGEWRNC